jgi:hypothetical protein
LLIFPEAVHYGKVTLETIPYFLGRIAISSGLDYQMLWGLDIIYELLQDEKMVRFLEDQYDFIYTDFIKSVRECDPFRFVERQLHIEQLQLLKEQVTEKERAIQSLIEQVTDIKNGLAYRMTIKYRHYIDLLLPIGTKRRGLYTLIIQTVSGNRSKM